MPNAMHTPGNWHRIDPRSLSIFSDKDKHGLAIAGCNYLESLRSFEEAQANANLICAAPELLICCKAALTYLLLDQYLDKEQLITELEWVLVKAEKL